MSETKQAMLLAIAVTLSTVLTVIRKEWVVASVGGLLCIGTWVQVGILAERGRVKASEVNNG